MSELDDKLNSILSNPAMMQQIMSLAQALNQSDAQQPPPQQPPAQQPQVTQPQVQQPQIPQDHFAPTNDRGLNPNLLSKIAALMQRGSIDKNQEALLRALRPYLNNQKLEKLLLGFASGVMIAAAVWSLLLPAIEMSEEQGGIEWLPAAVGFLLGMGFLLLLDSLVPHLHMDSEKPEGMKSSLKKTTMLVFAVTLHNLPEGMAVGVTVAAAMLSDDVTAAIAGAFVLAVGIAIQNFPEGAIISMPLRSAGASRGKAFWYGFLSGLVEPVGAFFTILLASGVVPILPYLLAFAAGAMIYVVVEELIPEAQGGEHTNAGTIGAALGFVLMMVLDVALG